jgi:hypothetical protein
MFYFQLLKPEQDKYQKGKYKPQIVALAEGLRALGKDIGCNIDYYATKPSNQDFLLTRVPFDPSKIVCLIVSLDMLLQPDPPTNDRMASCRRLGCPVIIFDWIANRFLSMSNPESLLDRVDKFMFYSYIQKLVGVKKYEKVRPWPIGYTQRVVDVCQKYWKPFSARRPEVLWSHRVPHHVRKTVWDNFYSPYLANHMNRFNDFFERPRTDVEEYDIMMNFQTGNRHNPKFYEALCSSQLVDCCGGFLKGKDVILQWDSYMLWEGFMSGCCVITLDIEYYGFKTGVAEEPRNMVHYIGLRLNQPAYLKQLASDIIEKKIDIEAIAMAGKEWAVQYFSPQARAQEFLRLLS